MIIHFQFTLVSHQGTELLNPKASHSDAAIVDAYVHDDVQADVEHSGLGVPGLAASDEKVSERCPACS